MYFIVAPFYLLFVRSCDFLRLLLQIQDAAREKGVVSFVIVTINTATWVLSGTCCGLVGITSGDWELFLLWNVIAESTTNGPCI